MGLGLICLTDYISTIYEVRIARETYHTPWTVRIGGVPLAEIFVLGAFGLASIGWLRGIASRGGRLRTIRSTGISGPRWPVPPMAPPSAC